MTKTLSPVQAGCVSRQAGVGVPVAGVPVCFGARARRSTVLWLILCVVFGFWISPETATANGSERAIADVPECAGAYGAQLSTSVAGLRIANGRRLTNGWSMGFWSGGFPLSNAMLRGGGDGIVKGAAVALFVSGLNPYLLQGQPPQPDSSAGRRSSEEYHQIGEQRPFSFDFDLEFLAGILLCGLVYWGGALWMERR